MCKKEDILQNHHHYRYTIKLWVYFVCLSTCMRHECVCVCQGKQERSQEHNTKGFYLRDQSRNKTRQDKRGTLEQTHETRRSDKDARTERRLKTKTNYTQRETQRETGE